MESETTYKVNNSRVYGAGWSYNLTNQKDAIKLCETLNHYETTVNLQSNIDKQFDKITKELIQVKMTLNILNEEVNQLSGDINDLNRNNR